MRKILISLLLASAAATPGAGRAGAITPTADRARSASRRARTASRPATTASQHAKSASRRREERSRSRSAAAGSRSERKPRAIRRVSERRSHGRRQRPARSAQRATRRPDRSSVSSAAVRRSIDRRQAVAQRNDVQAIRAAPTAASSAAAIDRADAADPRSCGATRRPPVISNTPQPGHPAAAAGDVARPTRSAARGTRNWRNNSRYDWNNHRHRHRSLFHLGFYYDPFGWGYQPYQIGWRMWPSYYRQQLLAQRSVAVSPALCAAGNALGPLLRRRDAGRHVERPGGRRDLRLLLVDCIKQLIERALRHCRGALSALGGLTHFRNRRGPQCRSSSARSPSRRRSSRLAPAPRLRRRSRRLPPAPVAADAAPAARGRRSKAPTTACSDLFKAERRGQPQAQPDPGRVPRRPALRRPVRRLHHRRILSPRRRPRPKPIWPSFGAIDRARAQRRPTSSPMTCSNIDQGQGLEGYQPRYLDADHGAPDQPFLGLPHILSDLCQRQGRGAVQNRRGL